MKDNCDKMIMQKNKENIHHESSIAFCSSFILFPLRELTSFHSCDIVSTFHITTKLHKLFADGSHVENASFISMENDMHV